jgi:hypothetical protein
MSAAVQQTLDRLPPSSELGASEAAAQALLAAAAEDAAWAWRMLQGDDTPNPGLTAAMTALTDHAAACCDEALLLLTVPAAGEPADRP